MITQRQIHCPRCKGEGEIVADPSKICKKCSGQKVIVEKKELNVRLEPGTPDKTRQTMYQEGNFEAGKTQGDFIVIFREKRHKVFRREEADLFMDKVITLDEAVCGTSFKI